MKYLAILTLTVAALGLGGLIAFWPALMGGSKSEQQQIVRLEAVVTWCEALRDTTTGHAGLEQAIPATAQSAAPAIRLALLRLTGQLRSKVPLDQALQDIAEQLNHSADLIIAPLILLERSKGWKRRALASLYLVIYVMEGDLAGGRSASGGSPTPPIRSTWRSTRARRSSCG